MRTMPTLLALASMTALHSIASAAGIPSVGVIEAPGVTCPSADAVLAALARVRGGPAAPGEPAFKLFVDGTAEVAHVDLRDGAGGSVLARDIPLTSADCGHAAEAIALIVERHFRSVEWSPAVGAPAATSARTATPVTAPPPWPASPGVPPPSLPRPAPAASPSPAPAVSPGPVIPEPAAVPAAPAPVTETPGAPTNVSATATATASPASPRHATTPLPRLVLGAGPAFWSRNETFAVALDARWRVADASPIVVGGGVLLPPLHASADLGSGGQVHVGAVPIIASVGWAQALEKLAVAGHASTLWTIERGQSQSIAAPATAWRTILSLGLGVSAAWPVTDRWRITGELDGYRTVVGRSYSVDGVPGTVLDPSPWQAVIVLGAEWVVLP